MSIRAALVAFAVCFAVMPAAADLNPEQWERDVVLIETGVIQALDTEFQRSSKREDWKDYSASFRQGLQRYSDILDPASFEIMLEIHRQLDSDFGEIRRNERWQDASFYLRNKFALVSFTLNVSQ